MARKKRVVKATRKASKGVSKAVVLGGNDLRKRVTIVLNNFLLFVALFLVSSVFGFAGFLGNTFLINLFRAAAMIFGFVAIAFLITLLILIIMKAIRKK